MKLVKLVKLVIFAKMGDFDSNYDFGTIDEIKDFFLVKLEEFGMEPATTRSPLEIEKSGTDEIVDFGSRL